MSPLSRRRAERCRRWSIAVGVVCCCLVGSSLAEDDPPARVISLAPSLTEIVFALGAGDRLVGVSSYCDYPEAALRVDRVGTFLQPNVEVILKKQADLVLAVPSPENRSSVESLMQFGVRVRVVRTRDLASILAAVKTIASDLGIAARGERLATQIGDGVARVRARVAGLERRRVLMVVGRRPLIAAGPGTYQDELLRMAGGDNVAAAAREAWPHLSMEHVIASAPEVIIDSGMGDEDDDEDRIAFWSPFPSIPAVRDDRVVGSGRVDLLRAGPRAAETLEALARLIHPEAFAAAEAGGAQ